MVVVSKSAAVPSQSPAYSRHTSAQHLSAPVCSGPRRSSVLASIPQNQHRDLPSPSLDRDHQMQTLEIEIFPSGCRQWWQGVLAGERRGETSEKPVFCLCPR